MRRLESRVHAVIVPAPWYKRTLCMSITHMPVENTLGAETLPIRELWLA